MMRHLFGCAALCLLLAAGSSARTLDLDVHLDVEARRLAASGRFDPPLREFLLDARLTPQPPSAWQRIGEEAGAVRWRAIDGKPKERIDWQGELATLPAARDARQVLGRLPPMADRAGSWLPAASLWHPWAGDEPFSYRVSLDLPATQRALVPGRLLSETLTRRGWHAEFASEQPAIGLDLLAGPWRVGLDDLVLARDRRVSVRSWFTPAVEALAADYRASAARYIAGYSDLIGPYPYAGFNIVAGPLPTGIALPGLTYLGEEVLRLPFIRTISLRHEVLHAWWGNGVEPDWAHGNWSEGLVTLLADHATREEESADAARQLRKDWLRDLAALEPGEDRPLREFRARHDGASQIVGYQKSAFVFLMLRDMLGTQAFNTALRTLWQERQGQRAGWDDLQRVFEQACGCALGPWFTQWLDRPGLPAPRITSARSLIRQHGYRLELDLAQDEPPWLLELPLAIDTPAGVIERRVHFDNAQATVSLELPAQPLTVRLDPQARSARRLSPEETPPALRQVQVAAGVALLLPVRDGDWPGAAREISERWLDTQAHADGSTRLVIGPPAAVDSWLATAGLERPAEVRGGTAQAWAMRGRDGRTLAVITAATPAEAAALGAKLVHYGRFGWVVASDGRVSDRGIWAAPTPAISVLPAP